VISKSSKNLQIDKETKLVPFIIFEFDEASARMYSNLSGSSFTRTSTFPLEDLTRWIYISPYMQDMRDMDIYMYIYTLLYKYVYSHKYTKFCIGSLKVYGTHCIQMAWWWLWLKGKNVLNYLIHLLKVNFFDIGMIYMLRINTHNVYLCICNTYILILHIYVHAS
jgi:hypothetical protein